MRSAGDGPGFYNPKHFVTKEFIDAVGERIEMARQQGSKTRTAKVPDEVIDACESSHHAAKGGQQQGTDQFDDYGIMSIVCRHDVPLFFANIDTPGEQQKYMVALVEHVMTMLPSQANVVVLYDIGCVVDRSLQLVSAS